MRIGSIQLSSNLALSPLAGYTNLPFRLVLCELGGLGFAATDLVNARSLLSGNPVALRLARTCPEDQPTAVQLFGADPGAMREAAILVEESGAAAVDINMGCPVRKVCRVGGGSAMMTELEKTAALVRGMVDAVRIPVTAKMRLGWDDQNLTAPDLARVLEASGVAAVFVHGRTREQGFSGRVNLAGIRKVVEAVREIPVIGNGDITTPEAAQHMLDETGCVGISVGRGAFYNPWIFRDTLHFLKTGNHLPEPTFEERLGVMGRHFEKMVGFYGEKKGCVFFRRMTKRYARCFGPSRELTRRLSLLASRDEFYSALDHFRKWREKFLDENGELLPAYRPRPLIPSFLSGEEIAAEDQIKVPKGPIEVW